MAINDNQKMNEEDKFVADPDGNVCVRILNPFADLGGRRIIRTLTFDGGTTNDPGDYDGTGNPATLFTVTGEVYIKLIAFCTTNLVGASATLEVGISGDTACIIEQTTAELIDANEWWVDTTPLSKVMPWSAASIIAVGGGTDIIQTVGTANITAGVIEYTCFWAPISTDGAVVEGS